MTREEYENRFNTLLPYALDNGLTEAACRKTILFIEGMKNPTFRRLFVTETSHTYYVYGLEAEAEWCSVQTVARLEALIFGD